MDGTRAPVPGVTRDLDGSGGASAEGRDTYTDTRDRLEDYFDGTAQTAWARLTSDAPVSRIRRTVREGREEMMVELLRHLPADLRGARVLDAGCGTGAMSEALALRGATVLAVDLSPGLLAVAERRMSARARRRVDFVAGDMLATGRGRFDHVVAMDSLIHYSADDVVTALDRLGATTTGSIVFTLAPKTPLLTLMWYAGKAFPRADRSPAIRPHRGVDIAARLRDGGSCLRLTEHARVHRGFYISQAMEAHR